MNDYDYIFALRTDIDKNTRQMTAHALGTKIFYGGEFNSICFVNNQNL